MRPQEVGLSSGTHSHGLKPAPTLRALAFSALVLSFYPLPAINIGTNTSLPIYAAALAALLTMSAWKNAINKYPAFWSISIYAPYLVSAAIFTASQPTAQFAICWKSHPSMILAISGAYLGFTIADTGRNTLFRAVLLILAGHAVIGCAQHLGFPHGYFPFAFLFNANSFAIAQFYDRVMCLFPEPSVYTSSIGPLLVFGLHHLSRPGIAISTRERTIGLILVVLHFYFTIAAKSGLSLLIIVFCFLVLLANGLEAVRRRAKAYCFTILIVSLSALGILLVRFESIRERLQRETQGVSSWAQRAETFQRGFDEFSKTPHSIFWGLGSNMSHKIIGNDFIVTDYGKVAYLGSINSITLTYILETGVLGLFVLVALGVKISQSVRHAPYPIEPLAFATILIFACTFVNSYTALACVWVSLGLLLNWPALDRTTQLSPSNP